MASTVIAAPLRGSASSAPDATAVTLCIASSEVPVAVARSTKVKLYTLSEFVATNVGEGGAYENVSEYIRDLIRRDKERTERTAFDRLKAAPSPRPRNATSP